MLKCFYDPVGHLGHTNHSLSSPTKTIIFLASLFSQLSPQHTLVSHQLGYNETVERRPTPETQSHCCRWIKLISQTWQQESGLCCLSDTKGWFLSCAYSACAWDMIGSWQIRFLFPLKQASHGIHWEG